MTLTLQDIKTEQIKLAEMIARFETSRTMLLIVPEASIELQPCERYAGLVLADDGTPSHHLVLLADEAEKVNWTDACTWAAKAGGELPTRREQALLFANLRGEFTDTWYWSGETHQDNGSSAWLQYFYDGYQSYYHKSSEGRARAVRRVTA